MRHVVKPKNSCPSWLRPATVRADVEEIAKKSDAKLVKFNVYAQPDRDANDKPISRTRDVLNRFYFGKCAYCEKRCRADIEHYRPKGGQQGTDAHSGYPWLGYEWSNLIPACTECNGRAGKLSQFPVAGNRVTEPRPNWLPRQTINTIYHKANGRYLLAEQPLILHPEIDDPIQYLAFRPDTRRRGIEIYGTDPTGRGDKTASVCYLNRQDLLSERSDVLRNMQQGLKKALQDNDLGIVADEKFPDALKLLFEQWDADSNDYQLTHTLLRKFVVANVTNLDQLVLQFLDQMARPIIFQYFQTYRSGQL